jgi:hypothetical protein
MSCPISLLPGVVLIEFVHFNYTVIQNFGIPLPKHSGRQLSRKFRVQNFYPKLWVFKPKLRGFEPKIENRSFVFLNQSCSFCKDFFPTDTSGRFRDFLRSKLRNIKSIRSLKRSFGWAETGEIIEVSGENESLCIASVFSLSEFS